MSDPPSSALVPVAEDARSVRRIRGSYVAGEFSSPINTSECPSIFDTSVKDFGKYITDPRGEAHRELFGAEWDESVWGSIR